MEVVYNNEKYKIHIVDKTNYHLYSNILDNIKICNREFISISYENLSYHSLEEDGYIGIFITDITNSIVYMSLIIDLYCRQIKGKLDNSNKINNSVEIVILCSNTINRIQGLTRYFLQNIITTFIPYYKPNLEQILLYIANGENNINAMKFYKEFGFHILQENIMNYSYKKGGNRQKNKRTKNKQTNNKRTNNKQTRKNIKRKTNKNKNKLFIRIV